MFKKIFRQWGISRIITIIIIGLLWNTPVVYPLKLFVVFLHELSHGLAAIVTGGKVEAIVINAQEGGYALTIGGSKFWTLTAGYLGSLVWGGLIMACAASRTQLDKLLSIFIGVGMIFIVLRYGGDWFIRLFGMAFGGGLIAIGWLLSESINDWLLRVIGLTSCLYAVLDIKSDVLDRVHMRSDAYMLAELTHIPTIFWGVLWSVIAIAGTLFFISISGRSRENLDRGSGTGKIGR